LGQKTQKAERRGKKKRLVRGVAQGGKCWGHKRRGGKNGNEGD